MKYEKIANEIIKGIGGIENVVSLEHCATRLRFKLKNLDLADTDTLENNDGIVTIMKSGGQYQIVVGSHVHDVYEDILSCYPMLNGQESSEHGIQKESMFNRFVDTVTGVFTPILGLLAATGVIKGMLTLCTSISILDSTSSTYMILYTIADGFFYSLPIFLGYTTSKKFNGNPFIGMTIGISLIYPSVISAMNMEPSYILFSDTVFASNVYGDFLGIPLILSNYTSSVLPVIFATYVASKIEYWLNQHVSDLIKFFAVPACTLLIVIPITFLMIGPITTWGSNIVGLLIQSLYEFNTILAGLVCGFSWQILVIVGLHWGPSVLMINNLATLGYDPIWGLAVSASFAQVGALLAVYQKIKEKKLKSLCIPATISGLFGITEPGIYGITLPLKRPFLISCIAAGVGGIISGFFGSVMHNFGGGGIFEVLNFIDPNEGLNQGWWGMVIACFTAFIIAFVLTLVFGIRKDKNEEGIITHKDILIHAPVSGKQIPLCQVKDKAFSSKALGEGIAIIPENGHFVSPVDGEIKMIFPTKHAIGILSSEGVELLIHIGIDTVKLEGNHFEILVKNGDEVKVGTPLINADVHKIKQAGYDITTPLIITNHIYSNLEWKIQDAVSAGEVIMILKEEGNTNEQIS